MNRKHLIAALTVAALAAGTPSCAYADEYAKAFADEYAKCISGDDSELMVSVCKKLAKDYARQDLCTADLNRLRIGMTEAEVAPLIKCALTKINTDETASGVRKQVVLYLFSPKKTEYLYFDNGRLTTIQRR